jgi:hypothetical protein
MATILYSPPSSDDASFDFGMPVYSPPAANNANFNFTAPFQRHAILAGFSDNISAIWADEDAGLDNGNLYIASAGAGAALSVINMNDQAVFDSYTKYNKGIADETLDAEDVEDLNVVLGS